MRRQELGMRSRPEVRLRTGRGGSEIDTFDDGAQFDSARL